MNTSLTMALGAASAALLLTTPVCADDVSARAQSGYLPIVAPAKAEDRAARVETATAPIRITSGYLPNPAQLREHAILAEAEPPGSGIQSGYLLVGSAAQDEAVVRVQAEAAPVRITSGYLPSPNAAQATEPVVLAQAQESDVRIRSSTLLVAAPAEATDPAVLAQTTTGMLRITCGYPSAAEGADGLGLVIMAQAE